MTRSWWMVSALATSLLVGACARQQVRQDEAQLGRLPIEEKQEIFTAQHNLTVAEANKAAADTAAREMEVFVKTARDEVSAARARMQAARSSMQLARRTQNAQTVRVAEKQQDVARRQLVAAQAKREYAERLATLRNEQMKLAGRQIDAAQAELALVRATVLQRNNIPPPGENVDKLRARREQLTSQLAAQERKVSGLRDETNDLQMVWEQRRQDYNVAARSVSGLPPLPPPSSPEQFEPEPLDIEQGGPRPAPGQNRQPKSRSNGDQNLDQQRLSPPPGTSEPSETPESSEQGMQPGSPPGEEQNFERPRSSPSQGAPRQQPPRQGSPRSNVPPDEAVPPENGEQ